MKKQEWTGVRLGPIVYKEIKTLSRKIDRPMSTIIRMLWIKYKKEVKRGL